MYSFSFLLISNLFMTSFSSVFSEGPPLTSQSKSVKKTISNLADVHAGVTAERSDCSQVIGLYQSGNNAILIHFSNHGGIHEIHQAILIQRNPYTGTKNKETHYRVAEHSYALSKASKDALMMNFSTEIFKIFS